MSKVQFFPTNGYGFNFIPHEYVGENLDEFSIRNEQVKDLWGYPVPRYCHDFTGSESIIGDVSPSSASVTAGSQAEGELSSGEPALPHWRCLRESEIQTLERQGNQCKTWQHILVCEPFNARLITNSFFAGFIRIASMEDICIQHHDLNIPVGIRNSRIISCDIGENCVIQDCGYLSHFIIGHRVILHRIDEMSSSSHAKFGEGIVKEGENEEVRIWVDPINEAGGRSILPFKDLICADAYLWSVYKDDFALQAKLKEITQNSVDSRRGYYSSVGTGSVIKSSLIIKDVRIGEYSYIKGANKLKNLTIKSRKGETSQVGEGVELVNGIIGYGCQVFYGVKAVRFVMGNNSNLKYGARLIHSVLGDNSTVSCCEVLNNLVFPGHEQHHNNSFLIAALVMGQSNMAAGATLGSNHNTRGNNGELIAGRGFWPGLACTVKHNSRFASFTLLANGTFTHELDNPFPFAMLSDDLKDDSLVVMPAYFWLYNMYALERNSWKYKVRDRRKQVVQRIETDYLAPDTASEIVNAIELLQAYQQSDSSDTSLPFKIENSHRRVTLLKVEESLAAYKEMLLYYGVKAVCSYLSTYGIHYDYFIEQVPRTISLAWVNMGGQLVPEEKVDGLRSGIRNGLFENWEEIHAQYELWWTHYPRHKAENGYEILRRLTGLSRIEKSEFIGLIQGAKEIRSHIDSEILATKQKDYDNPFRLITYRNEIARDAVLGKIEDDPFILQSQKESLDFYAMLDSLV